MCALELREGQRERRERTPSRLHAEDGAGSGAGPRDPNITTRAKAKSRMFNQLSHPGAPAFHFKMKYLYFQNDH